jgi:hypothetical protein
MAEQWAEYTREDGDTVVLQADAGNRKRYELKGFTFKQYVPNPNYSRSVGVQDPQNLAINVIQGRKVEDLPDVDESEVVKEAMEVALRKMTGTWTDAEQIAAYQAHKEGHLLPEESAEMLTGDPTAGYEAIAPKITSGELRTPLQEALAPYTPGPPPSAAVGTTDGTGSGTRDGASTAGADGSGTRAATSERAPTP